MATSSFDKDFIVEDPERIATFKRTLKNMKRGDNVDYTDELANYLGFDNDDYTVEDVSKEALKIIKDLQSDPWISVDDELPEIGVKVLCFRPNAELSNDPTVKVSYRIKGENKSPQGNAHKFACWCHVTHWMPLPDAPTKDVK